jgi:MSHA type pilus biogenesis protein MshL
MKMPYHQSGKILLILLAGLVLMYGCATPQPQVPSQNDLAELDRLKPKALLNQAKHRHKLGPPPFTEQMAPMTKDITRPPKLYSLVFENAPLGDVITVLTKDSEYNLSIESEVDLAKPVTVNLKNVTLEEALDIIILNGAGYAWTIEKETLAVKRFAERIYQLDCLDIVGATEIDVGGDMLGSGVENAGVTGKYQIKAKKTEQNSDLWVAVGEALNGMKSAEGVLRLNRAAGVIYMADTPRRLAAMERFLDSLTETLNRQVYIEARIMEVTLNNESQYGIDWSELGVTFTSDNSAIPDVFELGFNRGGAIVKGSQTQFLAMLDFLKTQGDVKVLSNPHLTVMNRQSALLTVGYQFPYVDIDGVDRDTETNVTTIGTSIKRAVLGLQLGLTTQINADGMITFHIVPTLTRIQREVDLEIPMGVRTQAISNPIIDLQELATTVRVREGDSFVLAGLISKIRTISHEGLPVLGKMPLLGNLFKHMENTEQTTELVILVTPYLKESSTYGSNEPNYYKLDRRSEERHLPKEMGHPNR